MRWRFRRGTFDSTPGPRGSPPPVKLDGQERTRQRPGVDLAITFGVIASHELVGRHRGFLAREQTILIFVGVAEDGIDQHPLGDRR